MVATPGSELEGIPAEQAIVKMVRMAMEMDRWEEAAEAFVNTDNIPLDLVDMSLDLLGVPNDTSSAYSNLDFDKDPIPGDWFCRDFLAMDVWPHFLGKDDAEGFVAFIRECQEVNWDMNKIEIPGIDDKKSEG